MKIEKLSLNKVKVTVSLRDLSSWDISFDAFNPDSPVLREFIMSLVRRAESEMGFDSDCDKWMIEAMPQNDEFVFLITRIHHEEAAQDNRQKLRQKLQNREFRVVKRAVSKARKNDEIYSFKSFEDFIAMFNIVADAEAFYESELYKFGEKYYLKINPKPMNGEEEAGVSSKNRLTKSLISEFGADEKDDRLLEAQLAEYGTLIARGNGFTAISNYF